MTNLTASADRAKATAAEVLASHSGFVISPNISEYALTDEEQSYGDILIKEFLEIKFAQEPLAKGGSNSRLIQARKTIIALNKQVVIALLHGEPETSDYIQNRSEKMAALIVQIEMMEGLSGLENTNAA